NRFGPPSALVWMKPINGSKSKRKRKTKNEQPNDASRLRYEDEDPCQNRRHQEGRLTNTVTRSAGAVRGSASADPDSGDAYDHIRTGEEPGPGCAPPQPRG